jgi:hypothetical protein
VTAAQLAYTYVKGFYQLRFHDTSIAAHQADVALNSKMVKVIFGMIDGSVAKGSPKFFNLEYSV